MLRLSRGGQKRPCFANWNVRWLWKWHENETQYVQACSFNVLEPLLHPISTGKLQALSSSPYIYLTHWCRVTHICVGKLTIIGQNNGLAPERRQAIIWTNAGILLIGPLGTNFSEISIEIRTFSLKKISLKISSAKCSFRLGLNVFKSQAIVRSSINCGRRVITTK